MNKEEKDVIDFLRVSAITKIEKTILSKEDVKCLLNYIDEYKKRTTFFREEIYRLNKKADKLQKELKDSINARFELQRRIDKLQKEFKDLELAYGLYKDRYETLQKENEELKRKTYKAYIDDKGELKFVFDNYISKDKIKEALGDKDLPDEMILTYIETLVSENNRLEDIEDRKIQIEYNNVFNKGVKSVEDKIRTKIEELEEKCEAIKKTYKGTYALNGNYLEAFSQIVILRELLGDDE